ncbi:MAG TPA: hypothetical protein VMJ35_12785 [Dongiaceae bacterium]|nr:hypothetical protein [Dongiaceae bacterium]
MAAYSDYLGATITVQYRLGDILLSATGVFVGDSGRSIFLEQHIEQRGRQNYFRWEIPYGNIQSIEKKSELAASSVTESIATAEARRECAAAAVAGSSSILPFSRPPKIA